MTIAPPSAGSSSPNTCAKLVCNRSPKSMAGDWNMGGGVEVLNTNGHCCTWYVVPLTYLDGAEGPTNAPQNAHSGRSDQSVFQVESRPGIRGAGVPVSVRRSYPVPSTAVRL